ncbi:uncharacterized protein [Henckelia pumila]|uniref:uncharacterized protein n=1 Tax=Henckelia pumila TaxID=405737 RepID=UPI003C6E42A0
MESNNQQCPIPANSNQDRDWNSQLGALTPEECVSSTDDNILPNNQHISYHRRLPDAEYVPVILSPGYCFRPEDDELIVDYLNKEINRERPEYIRCIRNVNVYDHSPEDLTRMYQSLGKGEWYFFTSRERKYLNGKRPNRAAGNGYWKATVADKKILANGVHVGFKKTLVFFVGKPSKGHKTDWIMHEYVSNQPTTQIRTSADDAMRLDDCVMCRIHKKYSKTEEETESSETWNQAAPKRVHMGTNQQQLSLEVENETAAYETWNQAAPKRVKTEHNQQQQLSLEVTNLDSQQNQQQAIHGQLHFGPESQQANTNPDEAQAIMDEDILQYINFDELFESHGLDSNPMNMQQPIMDILQQNQLAMQYEIWPNLPTLEQNHGHIGTNQQQLSLEVTNFNAQQNQQQEIHGQQLHFGPESL